jgi:hypothetical protein
MNGQKIHVASAVQTATLRKHALNKRTALEPGPWRSPRTIQGRKAITENHRRVRQKETQERALTPAGAACSGGTPFRRA